MTPSSTHDSFLEKWCYRWPEWRLAERFIPAPQRLLAQSWFALLQEFEDIMNIAGDPLPADAKLAWWQQELRDWSAQRSRHPLGRLLEPVRAPWGALAETLPAIQLVRSPPESLPRALSSLHDFALAVLAVESVLFARRTPGDAQAVAVQWLEARRRAAGDAALPPGTSMSQWRLALLRQWPRKATLARPHRVWARLARLRLQREQAGQPAAAPPLQQLWHCWRAASGLD